MTRNEIPELVNKARRAQSLWAELSYNERARRIKKAGHSLAEKRDEVTEIIHCENGKLKIDALAAEVIRAYGNSLLYQTGAASL